MRSKINSILVTLVVLALVAGIVVGFFHFTSDWVSDWTASWHTAHDADEKKIAEHGGEWDNTAKLHYTTAAVVVGTVLILVLVVPGLFMLLVAFSTPAKPKGPK